jgi:polyhydroxybutyrate depolymerase
VRPPRALLVALCVAASNLAHAARSDLNIPSSDGPRHAIVIPAGDGPHPTILVLHGALGTAENTARATGFAEAAARAGFTAVFPDGVERQWNDGRTGKGSKVDDVGFLRALVARLVADRVARPDAIYLAGISNGGMMSFTMACKAGALFAGIGTVIANMPAGVGPCDLKAMPLVMINGTADPMVPFRGGNVGFRGERGTVESVDATAALFATADGCDGRPRATPVAKKDPASTLSVTRVEWAGCRPGTSLTLYRVEGGGHGLPGRAAASRGPLAGLLGPSTDDIVGADVIVDAFAATLGR